jgi:endonuclease I
VPPSRDARRYRIGARCRDGWRSHATGSGACSWHGGVAEWLYADDRMVHDTKTDRELGTMRSVGTYAGRALQRQARYSLSLDEVEKASDRTFAQWKRKRLTDMRERDRDQFVFHCQLNSLR